MVDDGSGGDAAGAATPSSPWCCPGALQVAPAPGALPDHLRGTARGTGHRALAGRRAAELRLLRLRRGAGVDRVVRARAAPAATFPPAVMDDLPAYHLVANQTDVTNSQYSSGSDGVHMLGHAGLRRGASTTTSSSRTAARHRPMSAARTSGASISTGPGRSRRATTCGKRYDVGLEQDELRGVLQPLGRGAPRDGRGRGGGVLPALRTVRRARRRAPTTCISAWSTTRSRRDPADPV